MRGVEILPIMAFYSTAGRDSRGLVRCIQVTTTSAMVWECMGSLYLASTEKNDAMFDALELHEANLYHRDL